ncbi:inner membrane protein [Paenibacillus shirakamiensis]|uniref:Inner membrane protein n=1 Tax=Paenibacillus shirakamiensis TaxID=1265935 RepID=A0ABS4JHL6_9BACL|nr:metal-dependent hydrolase [Paenibacillus shirakamiensis]MBP2001219.1 inner membrane protein [Paenibacillus shirakamiensis]
MKGTTHLAIGTAIGVAACSHYPFSLKSSAVYLAVAGFSALSADLDGPSMLSSRIGQLSRTLRELFLWVGFVSILILGCQYFFYHLFFLEYTALSVALLMFGLITKEGLIRNTLISLIGAGFIYGGWVWHMYWLSGLGLFIMVAPWFNHRGMTHTVWAVFVWGAIATGLERELQLPGIMTVASLSYISHLLADTFTPSGVKWLFPLYKKPFKLP